ncbi:MAG: MlaD family protein [Gemmatimonadales bacterium]|nr:MlaD family protein [Gemmatimonadales bacterium]
MSGERTGVREALIGTMILSAAAAFVVGTNWLKGRELAARRSVEIEFRDVNGIKVGSPVRIAGFTVGRVSGMRLEGRGRVVVVATLPDTLQPRADASATITSQGLVGDAAVSFDPGAAAQPLPEGTRVIGGETGGLLDRAAKLGDRADSLLLGAQRVLSPGVAERLTASLDQMERTLRQAERTLALYGDSTRGPARQLAGALASVQAAASRLDTTLADPSLRRAIGQSDSLARDLRTVTTSLGGTAERMDTLLARIERGEGTAGRLVTDTMLHHNLLRTTAALDSLLADLRKHPGKLGITVKMF